MADLKSYWQEQARKAGLSEEQMQAVLGVLGDEKVAKTFADGFVTRPDYSRDLDKTRDEWKGKVDQYDNWYKTQAMPAYQQAQTLSERLEAYRKQYGDIDPANPNPGVTSGMSREDILKILDERQGHQNAAYMRVVKTISKANVDHFKRFGEPLPDEFEDYAVKRGGDPWDAYNSFISPKVSELQAKAEQERSQKHQDELKAAREEGARDALSKRGLPLEVKQEVSPLKAYTAMKREDVAAMDDETGRRGFLEEWNKSTSAA